MSAKPVLWRPMQPADLPAVGALAARIHPAFPEDDAVFAERLRLYPDGCHVLACDGALVAYVVSHPWRGGPPSLNSLLGELPPSPSTFYIHDLALAPEARGQGAASEIVAKLAAHAGSEGLPMMALVAVNGSEGFWRRHGFAARPDPALERKLASYGDDARFMTRAL
jgi:ribosomal protein S18 acetylase RimI-like enzyme